MGIWKECCLLVDINEIKSKIIWRYFIFMEMVGMKVIIMSVDKNIVGILLYDWWKLK